MNWKGCAAGGKQEWRDGRPEVKGGGLATVNSFENSHISGKILDIPFH